MNSQRCGEQVFFETWRTPTHGTVTVERKGMPLEHQLVLTTDQMGVYKRQARGAHALCHDGFTLRALAGVEWRCVDHCQHLRTRCFCQACGLFEPGVLAYQQADLDACARLACFKNTDAVTRHKIPSLVKHLVIGQLTLGVGGKHLTFAQDAGAIKALRHGHRMGAPVASLRMAHHHGHIV